MRRRELLALGLVCVLFNGMIHAAEKTDLTGTWKWTDGFGKNNEARISSLKLKHSDDKLTGKITLPRGTEIEIEDASFKDGEVTFTVTQNAGGERKATTKFKGALEGDTIKGKAEVSVTGRLDTATRPWDAKREKP